MKTLKVKSMLFSLLAIMAVTVFITSCQQDTVISPELDTMTQTEEDQAIAEYYLIASYGEETLTAYEAYLAGDATLSYFSPLGVKESVEFDWANYSAIMEHSKIITAALRSGKMDVFNQNLAEGTYVTRANVEELTPELVPFIDNPEAISTLEDRCEDYVSDWYVCECKKSWMPFKTIYKKRICRMHAPCNGPCWTENIPAGGSC